MLEASERRDIVSSKSTSSDLPDQPGFEKTIAPLVDMTPKDLERVLYFESFVVTEPGLTPFEYRQLLTEEEYLDAQDEFGEEAFTAQTGAEAVEQMLVSLELEEERTSLLTKLKGTSSEAERKRLVKRLKLVEAFLGSGAKPESMFLDVVPVSPPGPRPLASPVGVPFAISALNDLYRRVVSRNDRLKRLIELRAPTIIVRNERRMLQEAVDALFDHDENVEVIAHDGIDIFTNDFNHIAGTEVDFPAVNAAAASPAA